MHINHTLFGISPEYGGLNLLKWILHMLQETVCIDLGETEERCSAYLRRDVREVVFEDQQGRAHCKTLIFQG